MSAMPRIEIGAGALLGALAGFGLTGHISFNVVLLVAGIALILHGIYDAFLKPRVRLDRRLSDWLQRRGWSVRIEQESRWLAHFDFILEITSHGSEKKIIVTRDRQAKNDVLAFTARVGLHPAWLVPLDAFPEERRGTLIEEIRLFLATKSIGFDLGNPLAPQSGIRWPPDVKVQTGLPLDHTLSEHSVDMTAKNIEQSMLGVRALIRRATLEANPSADTPSNSIPSPESTPGTEEPQRRSTP